MKNNESFTYDELDTIYHALHDAMTLVSKEDDLTEEERDYIKKDLRDVAHKVALKMEAHENANSY